MARESVEGQTIELDWIRRRRWDIADREYLRMVHKKTGWYSFISPVQVGAIAAGVEPELVRALMQFALLLGIAFQIQDDLLSLEGSEAAVGKDALGDLYEGKYTLPLLHSLRRLPAAAQSEALAILALPRAAAADAPDAHRAREDLFRRIVGAMPDLDADATQLLERALLDRVGRRRDHEQVSRLHTLVTGRGGESLAHARAVARRHAERARRIFASSAARIPDSVHKQFINSLIDFVLHRSR
jgi:geranylgeranyl diphosphate synthase type II